MSRVTPTAKQHRRTRAARPPRSDLPYTMRLPDGRTLYVEVPGRWVTRDRGGQAAFLPEGVRFLDRERALALSLNGPPSSGHITALREALGLTQEQLGRRLGVDKITVSRWERGVNRPGARAVSALAKLRRRAVRRGVTIPA